MKRIVLSIAAVMLLSACEVVVEPYHDRYSHNSYESYDSYGYCHEDEPYYHEPQEAEYYFDHHTGYYEGVCATWLVGSHHNRSTFEEWCNWEDTCGWEYVASYTNYNYSH
jgi:hypothetical protein